ncbi:hypothetical protein Tco_0122239 [Tanacetum coccineum]
MAEAIATACYTQNYFIIHRHFNKTPYELITVEIQNISVFYMYLGLYVSHRMTVGHRDAWCKKCDIASSWDYSDTSWLTDNSKPGLQGMTSGQINSGLDLTYAPSTITTQKSTERELDLLFKAMYDDYIGGQPSATSRIVLAAQAP